MSNADNLDSVAISLAEILGWYILVVDSLIENEVIEYPYINTNRPRWGGCLGFRSFRYLFQVLDILCMIY